MMGARRSMVRMSDLSKEEWETLKRLLLGHPIQRMDGQTVKRLTDIGALQRKKNGLELSYAAKRLLIERMARIGRARNCESKAQCT